MKEADRKRYLRRLASLYQTLAEGPAVLSPRDAALLESWYERGIPLDLVESCLLEAFEPRKRRRRKPPRSLAYVAPLVEESWRTVLEGRVRDDPDQANEAVPGDPLETWRKAAVQWEDRAPALAARLRELAAAVADGVLGPEQAERRLDEEISGLVPEDLNRTAQEEVDRRIGLLPSHQRRRAGEEARRRALAAALRRRLGLPRLSLPTRG